MISKNRFVEIINTLKETDEFVTEVNEKAKGLKDAKISDFFNAMSLSISHEQIVVDLLENMFNSRDLIGWWIYELNYGKLYSDGVFQDGNGNNIDVSSAEKLYDYLVGG